MTSTADARINTKRHVGFAIAGLVVGSASLFIACVHMTSAYLLPAMPALVCAVGAVYLWIAATIHAVGNHKLAQRTRSRSGTRQGLRPAYSRTAAILTLAVLVLYGVHLAFVESESGINARSRWAEGKSAASLLRSALERLKSRHSGSLTAYSGGTGPIAWSDLELDPAEFDGQSFCPGSYQLVSIDSDSGRYTIQVLPAPTEQRITGSYRLDEGGNPAGTGDADPSVRRGNASVWILAAWAFVLFVGLVITRRWRAYGRLSGIT